MRDYLEKLFDSKLIDFAVGRTIGRIENGPLNGQYVRVGNDNNGSESLSGKDPDKR